MLEDLLPHQLAGRIVHSAKTLGGFSDPSESRYTKGDKKLHVERK